MQSILASEPWVEELAACSSLVKAWLASSEALYVIRLDSGGTITHANISVLDLLGLPTGSVVGVPVWQFSVESDARQLRERLARGPDPGEQFMLNIVDNRHFPHTILCRMCGVNDGYIVLGESADAPRRGMDDAWMQLNNQLSVLARENARQTKELAKAYRDLQEAQAMLVHQEKMASLGQMTAGVAHEINNPVAFVLNNEHLLLRDFGALLEFVNVVGDALDELEVNSPSVHQAIVRQAQQVDLENVVESIQRKLVANIEGLERVKTMVVDLRSFSRLDEADRKSVDVSEGILACIRFLGPMIDNSQVKVRTELEPVPRVICSPGIFNQAFSNILTNAIQASAPGQDVVVRLKLDDGDLLLEVEDSGCGIEPEHQSRIFDPFFTTKAVGAGTGLGLYISHKIVQAHSGTITVQSVPGKGTLMQIRVPSNKET